MASSVAPTPVPALAQPPINAVQKQITALLPGSLASAVTSQFAGASPAAGRAPLPTPAAASAALILPSSGPASVFLSLLQAA